MNTLIIIFYRIAAFFTRVPKKTREYNANKNERDNISLINENGFIESQETIDNVHFGSCTLSKNGCGPIATFNALNALGYHPDADDLLRIIRTYEEKGAALRAMFGTSPLSIKKYMESLGYITKAISSNSKEKLDAFAKGYDTFITIIRNNADTLTAGLHFICIHKNADGKYIAHNPNREADNIYDVLNMCSANKMKPVYTIGIKRKI